MLALRGIVNLVIREDDVCYFTEPKVLERIYRPLLDLSMPINLAVIPMVDCRLSRPFISPRYMGEDLRLSVEENKELVEFVRQYNLEVLQHGLTHEFFGPKFTPEFLINDREEIERRARLGMQILRRTFLKTPRFFVPPWDILSSQALKVLPKYYNGILLASTSQARRGIFDKFLDLIPRHLPLSYMPRFFISRLKRRNYFCVNNCLILEHKGLAISPENSEEHFFHTLKEFARKWCVILCVNHHWYFALHKNLANTWFKFMEFLLDMENMRVISVSDAYKIIRC